MEWERNARGPLKFLLAVQKFGWFPELNMPFRIVDLGDFLNLTCRFVQRSRKQKSCAIFVSVEIWQPQLRMEPPRSDHGFASLKELLGDDCPNGEEKNATQMPTFHTTEKKGICFCYIVW